MPQQNWRRSEPTGLLLKLSSFSKVVERCSFSRKYVIKVFIDRFGGFADYVNGLRIAYFERYRAQHPNSTEEAAAEASGFTSFKAYAKAKERLR